MAKDAPSDPFEMWREWLDRSEGQIDTAIGEMMARPELSESSARMLQAFADYRSAVREATRQYLDVANVPSWPGWPGRADATALDERLGAIESRLHGIESLLGQLAASPSKKKSSEDRSMRADKRKKPRKGAG